MEYHVVTRVDERTCRNSRIELGLYLGEHNSDKVVAAPHFVSEITRTTFTFIEPRAECIFAFRQTISERRHSMCQFCMLMKKHTKRVENIALKFFELKDSLVEPVESLFLFAELLVGGSENVHKSPSNFCKVLLRLAFDHHWSPSNNFPVRQVEWESWARLEGWHQILNRKLTRKDSQVMLRHDEVLSNLALQENESNFSSWKCWIAEVARHHHEIKHDRAQTITESIIDYDGAETLIKTMVSTIAPANEVTELLLNARPNSVHKMLEIDAGKILKKALEVSTNNRLGKVVSARNEPADIEIDGLQFGIQHTKADSRPWKVLGSKKIGRRNYVNKESRELLYKQLDTSIENKGKNKYSSQDRAKLILILDSGLLLISKEIIEDYSRKREHFLKASGYHQIWYICSMTRQGYQIFSLI